MWCFPEHTLLLLFDKRILAKLKGQVHKTVVRSAMLYGSETVEIQLEVRLRWFGDGMRVNISDKGC